MTPRDQTFDTFVIGQSNRFAHAASIVVAETPGRAYNPLFIFGGHGLGKTHLLGAIGRYAKRLCPEMDVEFVSGATLRRDFTTRLRNGPAKLDFERRYGSVDLLLIDDVQRLIGDNAAQYALMDLVIEPLCRRGNQVVLASDQPPRRFGVLCLLHHIIDTGLVVDIQPPDAGTAFAILRTQNRVPFIPDDAMGMLVQRCAGNIQMLLDEYVLVCIYAATAGKPVTVELIRQALGDE
jgi:chromosomal replication initiator protein